MDVIRCLRNLPSVNSPDMENQGGGKWLKKLILSVLLGIIVLQTLAWTCMVPLLEKVIRDHVDRQSKGKFVVETLKVDSDFLKGNLSLTDLVIRTNRDTDSNPIQVHIPLLELSGINAFDIYTDRELILNRIDIQNAIIELGKPISESDSSGNSRPKKLQPADVIKGFVNAIRIDKINIENTEVSLAEGHPLAPRGLHLKAISLSTNDWKIDSLTHSWEEVLGKVEMSIGDNDFSFLLPGDESRLHAGSLTFSAEKEELTLRKVAWFPRADTANKQILERPQLEIHLQEVNVQGLNPLSWITEDEIAIRQIQIKQPDIRVFGSRQTPKRRSVPRPDSIPGISLPRISIESWAIEEGDFVWYSGVGDSIGQIQFRKFAIEGERLNLKKAGPRQLIQQLLNSRFVARMEHFALSIPDNDLWVNGDAFSYASKTGRLNASVLNIENLKSPGRSSRKSLDVGDLKLGAVLIEGLFPGELWEKGPLHLDRLVLDGPEWVLGRNIFEPPGGKRGHKGKGRGLEIGEIKVRSGKIRTADTTRKSLLAGQIQFSSVLESVNIYGLRLGDSRDTEQILSLGIKGMEVAMNIKSCRYLAPDSSYLLHSNAFRMKSLDSLIQGDTLWFETFPFGIGSRDTLGAQHLHASFPAWELLGLRPVDLLNYRKLLAKRLTLRQPHVQMNSYPPKPIPLDSVLEHRQAGKAIYPLIQQILAQISLQELEIEAGYYLDVRHRETDTRRIELPDFDLRLGDIRIDSARHADPTIPSYFKEIFLALRGYTIPFGDGIHTVRINKMGISSLARLIYLAGIDLSYDVSGMENMRSAQLPNLYKGKIPLISLEEVNPFTLLTERKLEVGEVFIHAPDFELNSFPEFQEAIIDSIDALEDFERPDLYSPISGLLDELVVGRFFLGNGAFKFNNQNEVSENAFTAKNITVDIQNFVIDSTAEARTDRYFYADSMNVGINISDYSFMTPDSAYRIQVGNIGASASTEQVFADSIYLTPLADQNSDSSGVQWGVFIPRVVLEGLDIQKAYFEEEIEARKLEIRRPSLTQYRFGNTDNQQILPTREEMHRQLFEAITKSWKSVSLQEVELKSGELNQIQTDQDSLLTARFPRLFANGQYFKVDSLRPDSTGSLFFAQNWTVGMRNYDLPTADSMYYIRIKELSLLTGKKEAFADSIQLIPRYPQYEFSQKKGEWIDRMDVQLRQVHARGIDIERLLFRQEVRIEKVDLTGMQMKVFKDKRLPEPEILAPEMLRESIRKIPFYVRVDTVELTDSFLEYAEHVPEADEPGYFQMDKLSVKAYPISNDPQIVQNNVTMNMNLQARLMGAGRMRMYFHLPMGDPDESFRFEGDIDSMDLSVVNPMITHTAFLKVNSGMLNHIDFWVEADKEIARGKMRFYYNELNVAFLRDSRKGQEGSDPRRFASFLANAFVVKSDNPTRRFLRVGKIHVARNPRRSVFNYWANATLSGIRASIGAKNNKDKDKSAGWARLKKKN